MFISYAQNLEDVMLWRIFQHIENGFYIDVGANDPIRESVTKAFYDQGWTGINIEPVYQYYQRLCQERTQDINLMIAAGAEDGSFRYYEIPGTGLSTLDRTVAEEHQKNGWPVITRSVSVLPLSSICQQFVKGAIHFLKVDVEGAEMQVLLGMDFQQYRPWVVLIEATLPLSQEQNYSQWEHILLNNGYQYVYFDGLNRFYVAMEKAAEFTAYFSAPPNCFDDYQRFTEYELQVERGKLLEQIQVLTLHNQALQEELRKALLSRPQGVEDRQQSSRSTEQEQVMELTEQLRKAVEIRRLNKRKG